MLQEAVGKRFAPAPGERVWHTPCRTIPKLSVGLVSAALGLMLVFGGASACPALAQEATPGSDVAAEAAVSGAEGSSSTEGAAMPAVPDKAEGTGGPTSGSTRAKGRQTSTESASEAVGPSKGSDDAEPVGGATVDRETAPSDQKTASSNQVNSTPTASDTLVSPSAAAAGSSAVTDAPAAGASTTDTPVTDVPTTDASTSNAPTADAPAAETPAADGTNTVDMSSKTGATSGVRDSGSTTQASHSNVYRMYNAWTGEHLYTGSLSEAKSALSEGWRWEGVAWVAPSSGVPVYRLYNAWSGDHLYTTSKAEYGRLARIGWKGEGVQLYGAPAGSGVAISRLYNRYVQTGSHLLTANANERRSCIRAGWSDDGNSWYASKLSKLPIAGFWSVTQAWTPGQLQRYWIGSDAAVAVSRLIDPSSSADRGAGYRAWATASGAVIRGARKQGDVIYLADNDGRLATGSGWLVTDRFGQGRQRYYLYSRGAYSVVRPGISRDGATGPGGIGAYHLTTGAGHVLRGSLRDGSVIYLADNDGRLATGSGWQVTDCFCQGMQRYYLYSRGAYSIARLGRSSDGASDIGGTHYTTAAGYVLRNMDFDDGISWFWANNDGRMSDVTDAQRDLVSVAYSTPSPGAGLCAMWVSQVFSRAGYRYAGGNADDMYWRWCHSSDRAQLRVGMVIAVPSHSHSRMGSIYGHIGIYVGRGQVRDNVGAVRDSPLDEWIRYYSTTEVARWGYLLGIALA